MRTFKGCNVCVILPAGRLKRVLSSTYRSGSDLLQSILALNVAGVSHDDHDDWHVFVNECQGTMFQLPSKDAL